MSHNSYEGTSGRYLPTHKFSPSENDKAIPHNPASFPALSKAPHDKAPLNSRPATLVCPVPGCSLVFKGETPHGYLWRHLRHPGVRGRTGDQKAAWENLHKIQHDRLLATRGTTLASYIVTSWALTNLIQSHRQSAGVKRTRPRDGRC